MKSTFTEKERALFAQIGATSPLPGTVLENMDRLLEHIATLGVQVSPKNYEFGIAVLPELNARLVDPANIGLVRGRQQSYPQLDALHRLLRSSRLCKIDRSKTPPRMMVDPAMHEKWKALNSTERYFSLLEAWWHDSGDDLPRGGFDASSMPGYRDKLLKLATKKGRQMATEAKTDDLYFRLVGMTQIALLQMFGMLDISQGKTVSGEGWKIERIAATPWGLASCASFARVFGDGKVALMQMLLGHLGPQEASDSLDFEKDIPPYFRWARELIPFFPDWQHFLGAPEAAPPSLGSITVKVVFDKDIWRRITLPSDCTFADLAMIILSAFNFDDEHLYEFTYQDEYGVKQVIDDDRRNDTQGEFGDDVELGEVQLVAKQVVDFRYDFGDDWRFQVRVENVDPLKTLDQPKVIEKKGRAPKQYRWD